MIIFTHRSLQHHFLFYEYVRDYHFISFHLSFFTVGGGGGGWWYGGGGGVVVVVVVKECLEYLNISE